MKSDDLSHLPFEIAECYRVFLVRKSHHWNASPYSLEELWEDMPHTVVYQGGENDFKKMLPPFFELSWQEIEDGDFPDLWPLTPLASYSWRGWPLEEQTAIESCFNLLWHSALERAAGWSLREILSSAQHVELSWLPFLESWFASPLSSAVMEEAVPVHRFDELPFEARTWLCQPRVLARIEADFFAATGPEESEKLAGFYDELKFWCSL